MSSSDGCPLCDAPTDPERVFCHGCVCNALEYEQLWR